MSRTHFPENIRRLVFFHHASAKEGADYVGVAPHTLSAWITGKRLPGGRQQVTLARKYPFDPRALIDGDSVVFARELARPERIREVEILLRGHHLFAPTGAAPVEWDEVKETEVSSETTPEPKKPHG